MVNILPQEIMIERLRQICHQDQRLVAAMLYGSFTYGEADQFSDIDCVLFFEDEALAEIDPQAWLSQIAPVEVYFKNEFGNGSAIFSNLVRGEFHFDPASEMQRLEKLQGSLWFPSLEAVLILDRTGQLRQHLQALIGPPPEHDTPQEAGFQIHSFLNWMLFGSNVLARGEMARALELLHIVQDTLLRMARLLEGSSERWITPTRAAEREISPTAYARLAACSAKLESRALWEAYMEAWRWGNELMGGLAARHHLELPAGLIEKLDRRLVER